MRALRGARPSRARCACYRRGLRAPHTCVAYVRTCMHACTCVCMHAAGGAYGRQPSWVVGMGMDMGIGMGMGMGICAYVHMCICLWAPAFRGRVHSERLMVR